MIYILYGIFNINVKTPNSFFYYGIVYFRKKFLICLFFKAEIFFQNNETNRNGIIEKLNRYKVF